MASLVKRPLKLLCPCGYQRTLPDSLNGKKVVCPKCKKVLRVMRVERLAELFIKCPYCKLTQGYSGVLSRCCKCKRELVLPQSAELEQTSCRRPTPIDSEANVAADENSLGTIPEFDIRTKISSGSRIGVVRFGAVFLMTIGSVLIAYLSYSRFKQHDQPPRPTQTRNVEQKPSTAVPRHGESIGKAPRLKSPSIDIEAAEVEYGQALDQMSSELIGERLFLVITFRNLSECEISTVDLSIRFNDGEPSKHVHNFGSSNSLEALSTCRIELDFAPNRRAEQVTVACNKVTSGSQSDSTRVVKTFLVSE